MKGASDMSMLERTVLYVLFLRKAFYFSRHLVCSWQSYEDPPSSNTGASSGLELPGISRSDSQTLLIVLVVSKEWLSIQREENFSFSERFGDEHMNRMPYCNEIHLPFSKNPVFKLFIAKLDRLVVLRRKTRQVLSLCSYLGAQAQNVSKYENTDY